jgi:hypothetical protein
LQKQQGIGFPDGRDCLESGPGEAGFMAMMVEFSKNSKK